MRAHSGHHIARDVAAVERVRAAGGERAQRGGEFRVAQDRADRLGLAVRAKEICARGLVPFQLSRPLAMPASRPETLFATRSREKRPSCELSVSCLPTSIIRGAGVPTETRSSAPANAIGLRRAGRTAPRRPAGAVPARLLAAHGRASRITEEAPRRCRRSWAHQVQHELRRDHGIDRGSAAIEDLEARLDRQRMSRRDHVPLRGRKLLRARAGGVIGLRGAQLRGGQRRHEQQRGGEDPHTPPMLTYLICTKSSMPYFEPSRPTPDCLTPPKGATSVEMRPVFTPTMPASSASATRQTRPMSRA